LPGLGDSAWLQTNPGLTGDYGHADVTVLIGGQVLVIKVSVPGPMDPSVPTALAALMPTVITRLPN